MRLLATVNNALTRQKKPKHLVNLSGLNYKLDLLISSLIVMGLTLVVLTASFTLRDMNSGVIRRQGNSLNVEFISAIRAASRLASALL